MQGMRTGTLISGAGHAVVIALAVFGLPWFEPDAREAIRVTDVRFVTEAEFEAARSGAERAAEETSQTASELVPDTPIEPEQAPQEVAAPPAPQPPPFDQDLELSALAPGADPQAPLRAPDGAVDNTLPTVFSPRLPDRVTAPRPRPAPRIIEVLTPQPVEQEQAAPREEVEVAPAPQENETPREAVPEPETAPEVETAERIDLALAVSPPPPSRPVQRAAEPAPDSPQAPDLRATLKSLVAGATAPTPPSEPSQASTTPPAGAEGPPLSAGEKDGLRLAVQSCWIVPAGLRDAQELRVVLGAELTAQGDVISSSVTLIEPDPMPDDRFRQAYEAGRRALIRCSPYTDLPREKYSQWRNIEVVFNPEGMVSW